MSNPVALCTHIKTNGVTCGSPAVSGTDFCHHHSAIKTATGNASPAGHAAHGEFTPIPFVFPEDRASVQINFFLLLKAFNEHQIDLRTFKAMMSMLKAMRANLGKTGSLIDDDRAQGSENRAQEENGGTIGKEAVSKADGLESLLDLKASAIAPESCFSKKPQGRLSAADPFRITTLDLATNGFHPSAHPLTR